MSAEKDVAPEKSGEQADALRTRSDKFCTLMVMLSSKRGAVPGVIKIRWKDKVRWENDTDTPRTIAFATEWPFEEARNPIDIAAYSASSTFTVRKRSQLGQIPYTITPPVPDKDPPPGGPAVDYEGE
jgi:hypothetical protein